MPREPEELDPYAPPPRYKNKSGGMVRVVLLAALLGLSAWGAMEFFDPNAQPLVAEEQTQVADSGMAPDGSYEVIPTPESATTPDAPATADPQAAPATPAPVAPSTTDGDAGL